MYRNKKQTKAQGLSLNTIIIAVLVLIVLIVLVLIFTGKIRLFSADLENCVSKGGQCQANACPSGYAKIPNSDCEKTPDGSPTGNVCCIQIL
ncbi:hypothetical protein HYW21_03330 [Candidatus Woesearchaeota archaeon]|nr:hypothetical protein [Candidatus Woesearchaeota archaeon]